MRGEPEPDATTTLRVSSRKAITEKEWGEEAAGALLPELHCETYQARKRSFS